MKYDYTIVDLQPNTAHGIILSHMESGLTILECGCAGGAMTKYMKEHLDGKVHIVERVKEAFDNALLYAAGGVCADLETDDWISQLSCTEFDVIMLADVLEHLRDPSSLVKKLLPLLKEDGKVIVSLPNIGHNDILLNLFYGNWNYTNVGLLDNTHIHFWGRRNIEPFFKKHGLVVTYMDGTTCPTQKTEQMCQHLNVEDAEVIHGIQNHFGGEIYQFVFILQKADHVVRNNITPVNMLDKKSLSPASNVQIGCVAFEYLKQQGEELQRMQRERIAALEQERAEEANRFRAIEQQWQEEIALLTAKNKELGTLAAETLEKLHAAEEKNAETRIRIDQYESTIVEQKLQAAANEKAYQRLAKQTDEAVIRCAQYEEKLHQNEMQHAAQYGVYEHILSEMKNSTSWKITRPMRKLGNFLRGVKAAPDGPVVLRPEPVYPLVSVVIPIYDRTDVLIASIESILNQDYPNLELLLVCDGSPKETLDIVKSYEKHPKVRAFYYPDNSGNAVRGRNRAICEAKGKYLAFQDSDDVALPNRISLSVEYAEMHNADVVYGGWRALMDGSRDLPLENHQEVFSPDCDYDFLREVCVPCQSTVMVRLSALHNVGGLKPKMRYREDHELWARLAYFGYKFKAIPKVLTELRLHAGNLELQFKGDDEHWRLLMLEEHTKKSRLPLRVAFVIPSCGISGGVSVILHHANYLYDKGYGVTLLCTNAVEPLDWYPGNHLSAIPFAQAAESYDVVFATHHSTAEIVQQMNAAHKLYFVQADERKFYERPEDIAAVDRTYRLPELEFVTITESLWLWLQREFHKNVTLVENGIDLSLFHPCEKIASENDKLRVLIEGDPHSALKNIDQAKRIVEGLDVEVWTISPCNEAPGSQTERHFHAVDMINMPHIYSSCDVILKTSTYESFCLPAVEMMACGGTVVSARTVGVEGYIRNGENGYIFEQGDEAEGRRLIRLLDQDRELLAKLKENAQETAQQMSWENGEKQLLTLLNRFEKDKDLSVQ